MSNKDWRRSCKGFGKGSTSLRNSASKAFSVPAHSTDGCTTAQGLAHRMAMQTQTSPSRIGGSPAKSSTVHSSALGDSVALTKRLQSELMSLMASADPGVSAFPDGDSLFSWLGTIQGAAGTVYEGLSYKLSLKFPSGASSPASELQSWSPKLPSRIPAAIHLPEEVHVCP